MAKNTGEGYRKGSVTDRTQVEGQGGAFVKRDRTTGEFMGAKKDGSKYKGVAKEPDHRRDKE